MADLRQLRSVEGIVHWHVNEFIVRSLGRGVEVSEDSGNTFSRWCNLSIGLRAKVCSISKVGRRFFRGNIKHFERLSRERWVAFDKTSIWGIEDGCKVPTRLGGVHGGRPLRVVVNERRILYGEYFSNRERKPVRLWESRDRGLSWRVAHEFRSIRHIHGVFEDPLDQSIWVTTGDLDSEAAIWRFDPTISEGKRVLHGSQDFRVIDLLFRSSDILFGSDAPTQKNAIFRLSRDDWSVTRLQDISGPAFHAKTYGSFHVFTTVREPSRVNVDSEVEIWVSSDGRRWECPVTVKKDFWPMKWFQYGQILLPSGDGSSEGFWFTPFATKFDQQSFFFPYDLLSRSVIPLMKGPGSQGEPT